MVMDVLFWFMIVMMIIMFVVEWWMYDVLRDGIYKNSLELCDIKKKLDDVDSALNGLRKDIVEMKENVDEKVTKEYVDSVVHTFSQTNIEMLQSIDMLRKNVNDLRATCEINSERGIKVDDVQMKDVDSGLYGKSKTFAEMSFEDINIYNELNQKNEIVDEEPETDFSVEEL